MNEGNFYFVDDNYFIDFPDPKLMQNKETVKGQAHGRPCFYAFLDLQSGLYWLIPISSQVAKYEIIVESKIKRYGQCDTIVFGEVLGRKTAFLIQNMFPITPDYISAKYVDTHSNSDVRVNGILEKSLISKAKKVLLLHRKGIKLIFPDVTKIERQLLINK